MEVDNDSSGWSSSDEGRVRKRRPADRADGRHTNNRWNKEEHARLLELVSMYGDSGNWAAIAARMPGRTSKQVRQRYINFTRPGTRRAEWSAEEEDCIALMHATHGPAWSVICKSLENRTENAVKNHWHATLRSKNLDSRQGSLLAIYIRLIRDGALPCLATYEEAKTRLAQQLGSTGNATAAPMASPPSIIYQQQQAQQQQQVQQPAVSGSPMQALRAHALKQASGSLAKAASRSQIMKRTAPPRQDSNVSAMENGRMFQGLAANPSNDDLANMHMASSAMMNTLDVAECSADSSHGSLAAMHTFPMPVTHLQQQQFVVDGSGAHVPSSNISTLQLHGLQLGSPQQNLPSSIVQPGSAMSCGLQPGSAMSCGVAHHQQQWMSGEMLNSMPGNHTDLGSSTRLPQNTPVMQQQQPYTLEPRNSNQQIEALMQTLEQGGDNMPLPGTMHRLQLVGQPVCTQGSQLARLVSGMQAAVCDPGTARSGMDLMQEVVKARARAAAQLQQPSSSFNMPIKVEAGMADGCTGPVHMMPAMGEPSMPQPSPVLSANAAYKALAGSNVHSMGGLSQGNILPGDCYNMNKGVHVTSSPECNLAPPGSIVSSPLSTASDFITVPRSLLMALQQQQQGQLLGRCDLGSSQMLMAGLAGQQQQQLGAWQQQQLPIEVPEDRPSARLTQWLQKQNVVAARSLMQAVNNDMHSLQNPAPANLLGLRTSNANEPACAAPADNSHNSMAGLTVNTRQQAPQWGVGLMDVEQCSTPDFRSLLNLSCF